MHWPRGVRARLAGALILLVAVTAAVLGVGASLFVDARLHQQTLADAANQATFDLTVIVPGRQLPARPTVEDITRSSKHPDTVDNLVALPALNRGPREKEFTE